MTLAQALAIGAAGLALAFGPQHKAVITSASAQLDQAMNRMSIQAWLGGFADLNGVRAQECLAPSQPRGWGHI